MIGWLVAIDKATAPFLVLTPIDFSGSRRALKKKNFFLNVMSFQIYILKK
jgi:hypothetical protein